MYVSRLDEGTGVYFYLAKLETTTPGGLPARTALTNLFKSDAFQKLPPGAFTNPVPHPLPGCVLKHVRAGAVQVVPTLSRGPCHRRVRLRPPPGHPLLPGRCAHRPRR
jgi:hypothetical protein